MCNGALMVCLKSLVPANHKQPFIANMLNLKRAGLFGPISQPGGFRPPPRSRKPIDEISSVWY